LATDEGGGFADIQGQLLISASVTMNTNEIELPPDFLAAVEQADEQCEGIVRQLVSVIETKSAPDLLYHYTDAPGLFGILTTGQLRLTDMYGLNDPSELRHGISLGISALSAAIEGSHPAGKIFSQRFNKGMSGGIEAIAHFFVTCFSINGDELGQWRAYGDDGRGFAVCFNGTNLERLFAQPMGHHDPNNSTFPITYDDSELLKVHRALADTIVPRLAMPAGRGLDALVINQFMKDLSRLLSLHMLRCSLFFKHEGYRSEGEFRFLHLRRIDADLGDIKLRARNTSLIRFLEFPWAQVTEPIIHSITIGPAANYEEAKQFVQQCASEANLPIEDAQILRSAIPYRGR
jgi:hypothetical protein